jgi:hypothetical protein
MTTVGLIDWKGSMAISVMCLMRQRVEKTLWKFEKCIPLLQFDANSLLDRQLNSLCTTFLLYYDCHFFYIYYLRNIPENGKSQPRNNSKGYDCGYVSLH